MLIKATDAFFKQEGDTYKLYHVGTHKLIDRF